MRLSILFQTSILYNPMSQFENLLIFLHYWSFFHINLFLIIFFFCVSLCYGSLGLFLKTQTVFNQLLNFVSVTVFDTYLSNAAALRAEHLRLLNCLFLIIFLLNFVGLFPLSFTITSNLTIPFLLASSFFFALNLYSWIKFRWFSFTAYLPAKEIIWIAPALTVIEYISAISRVISLSLRLFANMVAGHILLKILITFSVNFVESSTSFPYSFLIWITLTLLFLLELFLSFLQSYVFTLLTVIYLNGLQNVKH